MTDIEPSPTPGYDLIGAAGAILAARLADGTYVPGSERYQAEELIESLDHAGRAALLPDLLQLHFFGMISVDCLLDEVDQRSYDLAARFADELRAEIVHQKREDVALHELVVDAICDEADTIKTLADYKAERTGDHSESAAEVTV